MQTWLVEVTLISGRTSNTRVDTLNGSMFTMVTLRLQEKLMLMSNGLKAKTHLTGMTSIITYLKLFTYLSEEINTSQDTVVRLDTSISMQDKEHSSLETNLITQMISLPSPSDNPNC
jgi:hypothetical protein